MPADQVNPALQAIEQPYEFAGIAIAVVLSSENDVLERKAALTSPVVLSQELKHLSDRIAAFGRHDANSFFGERIVQTDGQMTGALIEKAFQPLAQTYRGHGDAPWTPCPTIVGHEEACGRENGIQIVERLALSHKHDVRQAITLRKGIYLVEDIGHGKLPLKALTAGHAELASHLATHLTTDADRPAVVIRNEDCLHELSCVRREEIFGRAIYAVLLGHWRHKSDVVMLSQFLARGNAYVAHLVEIADTLLINPLGKLLSSKGGQALLGYDIAQLFGR